MFRQAGVTKFCEILACFFLIDAASGEQSAKLLEFIGRQRKSPPTVWRSHLQAPAMAMAMAQRRPSW
jgi:hypothetical protein